MQLAKIAVTTAAPWQCSDQDHEEEKDGRNHRAATRRFGIRVIAVEPTAVAARAIIPWPTIVVGPAVVGMAPVAPMTSRVAAATARAKHEGVPGLSLLSLLGAEPRSMRHPV